MFNVIINSEQYDEFMTQKEKIKELETKLDSVYKDYTSVLSDKAALIKERDEYKDLYMKQTIKTNELRFENDKVLNELESVKSKIKEPVATITINPYRDSEEAYSPDSNMNVKIENLYLTNNYFSEEDKNNGSK